MLFEAFFVVADVAVVVLVVALVVVVFIYCTRSLIVQVPILAFFILALEIVWEETHFRGVMEGTSRCKVISATICIVKK